MDMRHAFSKRPVIGNAKPAYTLDGEKDLLDD
jgi:hypothetical protein